MSEPGASHINDELVHGHDEHAHHGEEIPHVTMRDYLIGFGLSVVLTVIPFWLVMGDVLDSKVLTTGVILAFAVAQMLVHIFYFLHLNTHSQGGWNMLAGIFTVVLVVITISGSLWVMFNMNANMMPLSEHEMRNLP